jgi:hypothetical protein
MHQPELREKFLSTIDYEKWNDLTKHNIPLKKNRDVVGAKKGQTGKQIFLSQARF